MHAVQDAAPLRELAAFLSPSCPYHSRHCSTSSGQDSSATPPDYVPPEGARAIKKHGVLVKGGPRTMIREDVLDMFARHNLQVPPEAVTPFYQRRPGDGFIQHGWAVQLFSAAEVAAALRSSKDKVVRPASPLTTPCWAGTRAAAYAPIQNCHLPAVAPRHPIPPVRYAEPASRCGNLHACQRVFHLVTAARRVYPISLLITNVLSHISHGAAHISCRALPLQPSYPLTYLSKFAVKRSWRAGGPESLGL